ncbi:Cytochrome P450 71D8 [Hordeum vulgare]|nr:Cytochrome P450 71D8 [Hordeum vulgare]
MLRLVHGLDILGPREKMMAKAAQALIKHFDEPLSDVDMAAIARLTKMDVEAIKIAGGMPGPNGAAMEAPGLP